MFKTSNIIGTVKRNIDYKKRIVLPTFTDVKIGDNLVLLRDNSFYSIYLKSYFVNLVPFLEMEQLKKLREFLENKRVLDDRFNNVLSVNVVDKQKRILLPDEVIDNYGSDNQVVLNGAWDHLNIFKDDKHMKKVLKK